MGVNMNRRKRKADLELLAKELLLNEEQQEGLLTQALNISTIRREQGWQADVMLPHAMVVIKSKANKYGVTVVANTKLKGSYFFTNKKRAAAKLMEIISYAIV